MIYMPMPQPHKDEKQNDYMGRCMHFLSKKTETPRPQDQKVAICLNTYNTPKKKAKAEIEIDFTQEIKNMNKPQEIIPTEAPKVEAKVEEVANTAVTAPAPEIKIEENSASCGKPNCGSVQKTEETEAKKDHGNSLKVRPKVEIPNKQALKAQDNIVDIPDDQNTESLDGEKIQTTLMQMQQQYKILHWQTTSFSQHKSFDEIVSSLSENIDEFIETYMGKYGRVIAANTFNITLANYKDADFMALTNNYITFLIGLNDMLDKVQDSDLLNIRDEILGSLNQLKYLLSLV
jgi:Family of unknown function (DUF5856)